MMHNPDIKASAWGIDPYDTAMKALWCIIRFLSSTTDKASRHSFEACRRIHKWYTEIAAEALEDVAKAIQKWESDLRE